MSEFLYVETRKFHPDYDTPEHRATFRFQWNSAGEQALREEPRDILEVLQSVGRMHRAWNGPWCIPSKGLTINDEPSFIIDERNNLYRCVICGTAWHIKGKT